MVQTTKEYLFPTKTKCLRICQKHLSSKAATSVPATQVFLVAEQGNNVEKNYLPKRPPNFDMPEDFCK